MIYAEQGILASLKSVYSYRRDRQDYQRLINHKSYSEISRENMKVSSDNFKEALELYIVKSAIARSKVLDSESKKDKK